MTDAPRERHRLLERQLRKARDGEGAIDLQRLLDLISDAYAEQDEARRMTDHAVRLMSDELLDLNVKVRAEAAAEAQTIESRLYAMLEAVAEGLVVLNEEDRVVAFNGAAEAMFGRPRGEAIGQRFADLGLVETAEQAAFVVSHAHESGAEVMARRGGGDQFTAEVTAARMSVDRQKRTVTLWRDITARKQAEDALLHARDEARAANQAKSAFLAAMSHEIRTPLNGVLGLANALSRTELNSKQAQMARVIVDSGELLMTILSDILDFAKIEAGRLEIESAAFEPKAMLASVVALYEHAAEAKGLKLDLELGPGLEGAALGDAARLRQVAQNLISNAVKFTTEGAVTLAARLADGREDGLRLTVEVRDTGCGVPPQAESRLFMPFTQADSSTTRKYGGTGLGLALCRELVAAMGGEIGMRPNPGGGSCFWFTVPLARPDVSCRALTENADAPATPAASGLGALRILAVDDNATNRFVLQTILEAAGCTVILAENGREAVRLAAEQGFDAILMDVHMPILDGVSATREIRRLGGAQARTPIIAVTAEGLPEQIERARQAGMDDHVTKPIRPDHLLAVIAGVASKLAAIDPEPSSQAC